MKLNLGKDKPVVLYHCKTLPRLNEGRTTHSQTFLPTMLMEHAHMHRAIWSEGEDSKKHTNNVTISFKHTITVTWYKPCKVYVALVCIPSVMALLISNTNTYEQISATSPTAAWGILIDSAMVAHSAPSGRISSISLLNELQNSPIFMSSGQKCGLWILPRNGGLNSAIVAGS